MTPRTLFAVALILAGALGATAQTQAPAETDTTAVPALGPGLIALQIREGDIVIDRMRTMAMGGRFHTSHTRYMAMSCAACHGTPEFPRGVQFLRRDEFPLGHPTQPGTVDRHVCIACHTGKGALATPIYGVLPN